MVGSVDADRSLLAGDTLEAPLAWRAGQPVSRRQYLADVAELARRWKPKGPALALTGDRYRFALALGASLLHGQPGLLPPNHTPDMLARLTRLFPGASALADTLALDEARIGGMPAQDFVDLLGSHADEPSPAAVELQADTVVAQVLTSGSTGAPMPHPKVWDRLVLNIAAEARRVAEHLARPDLRGVVLVGTVPPHHMYGFESTVLLAMRGGASFATERPFFPAEIADVLAALPRPRVLVTTPFHLKNLLDASIALPPVDLVISATAPLSPQMAARAEAALQGPLMEIYGCTEAGQVATRRSTAGPEWTTFDGLWLSGDGAESVVQGGHVQQPTPLADVLEVIDAQRFRLLGRSNDLINIAGKRSSLSHLNFHLNSIEGVRDGAVWLPPHDEAGGVEAVQRLTAFVVPEAGLTREHLLARLRERVDAAFLPRPIVFVDSLPRDPTGKLPTGRLAELATSLKR
ncbi:AMP-binding protein [Sphaerotilus mobilis]|uniref:Acyl-coenzyme A synthetase/AMP-(Fatty) acid ligase n=1 Tax=Sphaerotilus mobilis TaxID=47994 RepID=A0A4Q7LD26_9BURK|nr:AMP-binding protein [Sphaerotilus mobilis]RZS51882.1 acyl-coenzyme A synthetase/AMP-(fatty) acid ligase [Sphaerotilus mobilis]